MTTPSSSFNFEYTMGTPMPPSTPSPDTRHENYQLGEHQMMRPFDLPDRASPDTSSSGLYSSRSLASTTPQAPARIPSSKIAPLFIDSLAKEFGLEPKQRLQLHTFAQLGNIGGALCEADVATRVYTLAVTFGDIAERHRVEKKNETAGLKDIFKELKIRLEDTFSFTSEQKAIIRSMAQDILYQPTRTAFKSMDIDVGQTLRRETQGTTFSNVYNNASREKMLGSLLKKTCSSVRNGFRQDLRDSVFGTEVTSLTAFSYSMAMKYKRGGPGEKLDQGYILHNAILRHFVLSNPALVVGEEDEDEDTNETSSPGPGAPAPKKRKRPVGRVPNGEDFWSKVDVFFVNEIDRLGGRNLTAPKWKAHIDTLVRRDNARFDSGTVASYTVPTTPEGTGSTSAQNASSLETRSSQSRDDTSAGDFGEEVDPARAILMGFYHN